MYVCVYIRIYIYIVWFRFQQVEFGCCVYALYSRVIRWSASQRMLGPVHCDAAVVVSCIKSTLAHIVLPEK